jgi:hypothetical protein
VDHPSFNASLPEKKAVCVTQSDAESESIRIQETQNSESTLVASAQPPTRMTAIRQKLQQDILSVDPVKAKIQSNSSQLKSSLPRPPSVAKSIPVVSCPAIAESSEDNTPVKTTAAVVVDVDVKSHIRGTEPSSWSYMKHGKSTEVTGSASSIGASSLEFSSSSGPPTRSRTKSKPILEESSASKRSQNLVLPKEPNLPFTFKENGELETDSVQRKAHISSRKSIQITKT